MLLELGEALRNLLHDDNQTSDFETSDESAQLAFQHAAGGNPLSWRSLGGDRSN